MELVTVLLLENGTLNWAAILCFLSTILAFTFFCECLCLRSTVVPSCVPCRGATPVASATVDLAVVGSDGSGQEKRLDLPGYHNAKTVMQFASREIWVSEAREDEACENEWRVEVVVVRYGNLSESSQVSYCTEDGEMEKYKDYVPAEGQLEFTPGETTQRFMVSLCKLGNCWAPRRRLTLMLSTTTEGAAIGRVASCDIVVITTTDFPCNLSDKERSNPKYSLVRKFVKTMVARHPVQVTRCCLNKFFLAFNDTVVATLILQIMVDVATREEYISGYLLFGSKDLSRCAQLLLLVLFYFFSNLLARGAERYFEDWNMAGPLREYLRNQVYRKFWFLTEGEHRNQNSVEWLEACLNGVDDVLKFGFMEIYLLVYNFSASIFGCLTVCYLATKQFQRFDLVHLTSIAPLLSMGIVSRFVRKSKRPETAKLVRQRFVDNANCMHRFIWICNSWPVVIGMGFHKRLDKVYKDYRDATAAFKKSHKALMLQRLDLEWIHQSLLLLTTTAYMLFGCIDIYLQNVHEAEGEDKGRLTVGTFLAVMSLLKVTGTALASVMSSDLRRERAAIVAKELSDRMNTDDGEERLQAVMAKRLEELVQSIEARGTACLHDVPCFSTLTLRGVNHVNTGHGAHFHNLELDIPVGKVVALRGHGTRMIMRFLAGLSVPQEGVVYVPPHLSVVAVEEEPNLIDGHLFENLLIGAPDWVTEEDAALLVKYAGLVLLGDKQNPVLKAASDAVDVPRHSSRTMARRQSLEPDERWWDKWSWVTQLMSRPRPPSSDAMTVPILGDQRPAKKHDAVEVEEEDKDGQEEARAEIDPQKSAEYLALKDQVLVNVVRALLSDPDILVVFSARWPSGVWRRDLYRAVAEWQRAGGLRMLLRKLRGQECPDPSDVSATVHTSSLLLSFGEEDLYWQDANPDFEVIATMDNIDEGPVVRATMQRASGSWRGASSRKVEGSERPLKIQDDAAIAEGQEILVARRAIDQLACKAGVLQGQADAAKALQGDLAALQAELTKLIGTSSSKPISCTNRRFL